MDSRLQSNSNAPTQLPYLDWFVEHIPHRVRSALAGTHMLIVKLQDCFGKENVRTASWWRCSVEAGRRLFVNSEVMTGRSAMTIG